MSPEIPLNSFTISAVTTWILLKEKLESTDLECRDVDNSIECFLTVPNIIKRILGQMLTIT